MKTNNFIFLVIQNISYKYKKTLLGLIWIPLTFSILVGFKSFILTDVLNINLESFIPYFSVGLLFWFFFIGIINDSLTLLFNNQTIINIKINPLNLFHLNFAEHVIRLFLNSIIVFFLIFLLTNKFILIQLIFANFFLIIFFFEVFIFFSIVPLFIRDLSIFLTAISNILFFITPIFWSIEKINFSTLSLLQLNPLLHILQLYRKIIDLDVVLNLHLVVCLIIFLFLKSFNTLFIKKIIKRSPLLI